MAGTVADIFTLMEMLDQELETGSGEIDEVSALNAVIQAQYYFETVAATYPKALQDTLNISTVQGVETTTWPSALLRLDALWMLDTNGLPIQKVEIIEEAGGHVPNLPWPVDILTVGVTPGTPYAAYVNMNNLYWLPMPDSVRNLRVYGLLRKARFVDRTSAVNYEYGLHLPLAQFAVKVLQMGADDVSADLNAFAGQVYTPTLKMLRNFNRTGPKSRRYTEFHTT